TDCPLGYETGGHRGGGEYASDRRGNEGGGSTGGQNRQFSPRHRPHEIMIEFTDGARLYLDTDAARVDLSPDHATTETSGTIGTQHQTYTSWSIVASLHCRY